MQVNVWFDGMSCHSVEYDTTAQHEKESSILDGDEKQVCMAKAKSA